MTVTVDVSRMADPASHAIEIVERKGAGHPDSLCDALAEHLSGALSRFYLNRFGEILHHNVDKVLLRGGASRPRFGGGTVIEPIEIYLAGRATRSFKGVDVPVEELAIDGSRDLLKRAFRFLDVERHVRIHCLVRPGSDDLVDLFGRQQRTGIPLANDSSIGVGYAPLSRLEQDVLALDELLGSTRIRNQNPALGEDVKLLAARRGTQSTVTVACALCDRHVADLDQYLQQKRELAALTAAIFGNDAGIAVNAADDPDHGSIYLTVTGTSAEAGDDGQAGRGNRLNGLITPGRPMTIESVAGKNPVSHIGKLYNHAARAIAQSVVARLEGVSAAECYLVSQIGAPITEPRLTYLRLVSPDSRSSADLAALAAPLVREVLESLNSLWRSVLRGSGECPFSESAVRLS